MSSAEPFVLQAPLTILYQDEHLVAIDKPSGMLVHRSFLDKHETVFVMQTLRDQIGRHVFPVHRLDRPTSGVLLFALSSEVARLLGQQQEQQLWRKFYLAVVRGFLPQGGELDYPLKEQLDDIADKFSRSDKAPQQAITRFQPLQQVELQIPVSKYPAARYSLVALQPLTGRKHQLRRHLAHLRHPIVGDTSHGDGKHNALFKQHFNCRRLLLVAKQLQLLHPLSGETLLFSAGLNELIPLFQQFGWPTDDAYYQQQFAELFTEQTWQKLQ
ncbi:MAG: tRNA pseudouridine(65) synthase TruC [Gammaproteobacteria bacterium]|nr:tRNA pseudouridine(65) synthase TruC [Gammaproteobacteria bacterium]MBU1555879.1 tRNA pseudouridine(65) synthase TruC [Gammaproteobacteria bacterium]MBU2071471.1 tRNA pseudouridine(65) synthase TruC [Gammaproteobacteria bacterium]MBU2182483.1 tRNA pseudouridine(65) synthase TruC [Gammaproteobacteria bacterium]MBU2205865.1 tRNA pseudouridine(65) synthase TruC [Gammaproteobacteria bacterium]